MALEYTIGYNQLIFLVTVPASTQVLINDLLTPDQKDEIGNHSILDGYIYGFSEFYIAHKINGDEEPFEANSYAFFPFFNWHKKVYIRSPSSQTIRLKFILDFN